MKQKIAKVAGSVRVGEFTKAWGVGAFVDLDERIGKVRVGDVVNKDHFEDAPGQAQNASDAPAAAAPKEKPGAPGKPA